MAKTEPASHKNTAAHCCIPAESVSRNAEPGPAHSVAPAAGTDVPEQSWCDLPGGWFRMGSDTPVYPQDGESPARSVRVDPLAMSATAITSGQFSRFASATGYQTHAEKTGWSFVFQSLIENPAEYRAAQHTRWWLAVPGACWHHPAGPAGPLAIDDHPVVHIAWPDAQQYCNWSGTRLATEAEWEYAARGGLSNCLFPWGSDIEPDGRRLCNVWRGDFPNGGQQYPHYSSTVPAANYAPNDFGLYNMTGNVWEWVADRFTTLHSPRPVENPRGPLNTERYVSRGGSYLCHESYCSRYHVFSRQGLPPDSTAGNLGFRVVKKQQG